MLQRLSLICQTISYLSLTAIGILMFETHVYVGGSFFAGCIVAFFLLRVNAMNQAEALATGYAR